MGYSLTPGFWLAFMQGRKEQNITVTSYRYIETTYDLPGEEDRWRAHVVLADSPRSALTEAKRNTVKEHPQATNIEEFMQHKIGTEKAMEIMEKMRAGTWDGWFEDGGN